MSHAPALYSFEPDETEQYGEMQRTESTVERIREMVPNTHKIVITRDVGERAMRLLEQERSDLSVFVSGRGALGRGLIGGFRVAADLE